MKKYLFLILLFTSSLIPSFAQQSKIDSLKKVLLTAKEDSNKVNILYELSEESTNDADVLHYALEALPLAEKLNYKKGIANAANNIGYVYNGKGQVENALEYYSRALKIYQQIYDKKGIAKAFNNLGYIYQNQKQTEKALEYFNASLKIFGEIGDKKGAGYTLNNIGLIYDKQLKSEKALECFTNALNIQGEIDFKQGMTFSLNNIGLVYHRKALGEKKPELREQLLDTALKYYSRALQIQEEIGDNRGIAAWLNNIGGIYLAKKNYRKAEQYCERALQIAKEIGYASAIKNSSNRLSTAYKGLGNYRKALEMHELFKLMADSINNEETQKTSLKKQVEYEFEKKEVERQAEQDKKDALTKQEKELSETKQFWIEAACASIIFALISVSLILYRRYKAKKKNSEELAEKNKIIEEKQKDILDSIHYAKRIQQSLLPTEKYIERSLKRLNPD